MNDVVFKYVLEGLGDQSVMMPVGAKILTVDAQRDIPCLWAQIDSTDGVAHRSRHIVMFGTGHLGITDKDEYISTFQMQGGTFVFHAFERHW
jgi:hypothetical protein